MSITSFPCTQVDAIFDSELVEFIYENYDGTMEALTGSRLVVETTCQMVFYVTDDVVHDRGYFPLKASEIKRLEWNWVKATRIDFEFNGDTWVKHGALFEFNVNPRHRYHPTRIHAEDVTEQYTKAVQIIEKYRSARVLASR
jgi:hypothetical protein